MSVTGGLVHLPVASRHPVALLIPESGMRLLHVAGAMAGSACGDVLCVTPHGVIPVGVHCRGGPVVVSSWYVRWSPGCVKSRRACAPPCLLVLGVVREPSGSLAPTCLDNRSTPDDFNLPCVGSLWGRSGRLGQSEPCPTVPCLVSFAITLTL